MEDVPLLIEFAPHTSLYRERELVSQLPIIRNGPAGTFVVFPRGLRVSLPTDQIIVADDTGGHARVGFGGRRVARRPSRRRRCRAPAPSPDRPRKLRQQPERPRARQREACDVDMCRVRVVAAGNADPLELCLGFEERRRVECIRDPHPSRSGVRRPRPPHPRRGTTPARRPGSWFSVPGITATSSPAARHSSSSVEPAPGSLDGSESDPPQPTMSRHDSAVSAATKRIRARV